MSRLTLLIYSLMLVANVAALAQQPGNRFAEFLERKQEQIQQRRELYQQRLNIQYARHPDTEARRNSLDLYIPQRASQRTPAVIFVHGGAWQFGDKRRTNSMPQWLAKQGIALISTNYRFVPDVTFDEQASDIASAIAWVRSNANDYNIDPNRIFLMGHSAGAHLVALVATDSRYLEKHQIKPSDLAGVIPIDGGGLDVTLQIEIAETAANERLYKKVFGEDAQQHANASPVHYLKSGNRYPPFLVPYVSTRKSTAFQARNFVERLKSVGGSGEVYGANGKTHMTINRDLGVDGDETTAKIMAFIQSNLGVENPKPGRGAFHKITLHKSGGFAGVRIEYSIDADGTIRENGKVKRRLTTAQAKVLQQLFNETDWSRIPKQVFNGDNVADDFRWKISIATQDKSVDFEIDGLQLENQKALLELTRIVQ